jgi:hypothetical protein
MALFIALPVTDVHYNPQTFGVQPKNFKEESWPKGQY